MTVTKIKLGEKTYSTGKITARMTREALKIQKEAMELMKKGAKFQDQDTEIDMTSEEIINISGELIVGQEELSDRMEQLIIDAYGDKFTIDELENELSTEEIGLEFNKIFSRIPKTVQKAAKN